jgi:hypothetical protein
MTWANAMNGTLALNSSLSNYYLNTNPFGFYNSTTLPSTGLTWSEIANGSVAFLNTILGFNYYNATTLPAYLENDTFQSVTDRGQTTTNILSFFNITHFYDDVFIHPKMVYSAGCTGTPEQDCTQFTNQGDCEYYNNHASECSWSGGEDCGNFDYDESTCTGTSGCTPQYGQYDCGDFDYNEGDCISNGCSPQYTYSDCTDFNSDFSSCSSTSGCTPQYGGDCSMEAYPDCLSLQGCTDESTYCGGNYFTSCYGQYNPSYASDCQGTYGSYYLDDCQGTYGGGCSGTLTCTAQLSEGETACNSITGCTYNITGTVTNTPSNLDLELGNITANGNILANKTITAKEGLCVGTDCDTTTWKTQLIGNIFTNGLACFGADNVGQCSDSNWGYFFANNVTNAITYGYTYAFKSRNTNRAQMQVVTSDQSKGMVFGYYDGKGIMQLYGNSSPYLETLEFIGGSGLGTQVTLKSGNYIATDNITGKWGKFSSGINAPNICYSNGTGCSSTTEALWNANYSTFLSHITWANILNGTIAKTSDLSTNDLHNHSIFNITGSDTNACSGTDKVKNVSFVNGNLSILCGADESSSSSSISYETYNFIDDANLVDNGEMISEAYLDHSTKIVLHNLTATGISFVCDSGSASCSTLPNATLYVGSTPSNVSIEFSAGTTSAGYNDGAFAYPVNAGSLIKIVINDYSCSTAPNDCEVGVLFRAR